MHAAAHGPSGTEDMREAMVESRGLFEALVTGDPATPPRPSASASASASASDGQGNAPRPLTRRHAKGSRT